MKQDNNDADESEIAVGSQTITQSKSNTCHFLLEIKGK